MIRRLTAIVLSAAAAFTLCGCASVFDAEYVVETSYEPLLSAAGEQHGDTTVRTLDELKQALLTMVAEGESSRRIAFDPNYEGDVSGDMASACWQVRTQDALCAYCVENIAYDVSKIVNYYEADVSVTYTEAAGNLDRIVQLPYAADAGELLRRTMEAGEPSLVLLIDRSSYTAESMEDFARQVYRENPAIAPQEPQIHVDMTSGSDTQRLYEFFLSYGLPDEELAARREALASLDLFVGVDPDSFSEAERAVLACCCLLLRCRCTDDAQKSTIYDALIGREANSRGMAYAYVELCRRLGLDCQIVDGQYNREDYSWNIVQINGEYYHVDTTACSKSGMQTAFLLNDEAAWGMYRWDYFAYPHCSGSLSYGPDGFQQRTESGTEEDAAEPDDGQTEISTESEISP